MGCSSVVWARSFAAILAGWTFVVPLSVFEFCALAADPSSEADRVAAVVGSEAIRVEQVRNLVERVLDSQAGKLAGSMQTPSAEARQVLEAQALEELVARRLVMAYARRRGSAVSSAEADYVAAQLRERAALERPNESKPSSPHLRQQAIWQLQWAKYLARYATETRVEDYFRVHRRDLDGTEISVRHILIRPKEESGDRSQKALMAEASRLREEIVSGSLEFEDAARVHSVGPSAAQGGLLGRIGRHGPMVEAFSAAAFGLEPGEISQPVKTPFGVHLIRCDAIYPGDGTLDEAREQILAILSQELLKKLADVERNHTRVTYTGQTAYFRPGTKELASPKFRQP